MIDTHNGLVRIQLLAMMSSNILMSGRKFLRIMRDLHLCGMNKQVSGYHPEYDPLFKIRDFRQDLDHRFNPLFVPGRLLRPNESLVCVFGRMEFKVRITKKAARSVIKTYVVTDALMFSKP